LVTWFAQPSFFGLANPLRELHWDEIDRSFLARGKRLRLTVCLYNCGELYDALKKRAALAGLPYQRFIRLTLEQALATNRVSQP
jgi:predicted DNA binding CopG/RHH family protein